MVNKVFTRVTSFHTITGNMSTKLGLSVMIGRCFLIMELMLGPSGLYCVVNIIGFILLFTLFC